MWDSIASLFSSSGSAANAAATAATAAEGANAAQSAWTLKDLANIGSLAGGLGSAYGSVMGANLQNGYAKKMLNLQEDNIAYQKEKEKKKQAAFDLAASTAFAPTVAPKLNLGA